MNTLNNKRLKILWVHSFNSKVESSGVFMKQLLSEITKSDGIKIDLFETGPINILTFIGLILKINRLSKKYDIIHSQYGSGCGFVSSFCKQRKLITLRGTDWYRYRTNNLTGKIKSYIIYKLTNNSLSRFDLIITVSERMSKEVREDFKSKQILTVPDGINLDKFSSIERNKAREKIGINGKNKIVLFSSVTDNNPVKRHQLSIEAFNEAKLLLPNLELLYMHNISHDLVPYYINSSDLILLTSTHEGWPNIIKEGLACNIPFVSTDVSDLRKISSKTSLCYICSDTPKEIASKMIESLLSPIKEDLRKHVMFMDMKKIAKKLVAIYQEHSHES